MRDSLIINNRKKQEQKEKREINYQKQEIADILLNNLTKKYIKDLNYCHLDTDEKIEQIFNAIFEYQRLYDIQLEVDYYYYYLLSKYDRIGNTAKKYALNSVEYNNNLDIIQNEYKTFLEHKKRQVIKNNKNKHGFAWCLLSLLSKK